MAKIKNYSMCINKVFTGEFLSHYLGHDLINFLVDDNNKRYIYLNPLGRRNEIHKDETNYAFHIIQSPIKDEKGTFELMGVSKIDHEALDFHSQNRELEKLHDPIYKNHTFYDIFNGGNVRDIAHSYSFPASKLLRPSDGVRIIVKINQETSSFDNSNPHKIIVRLMSNPAHNTSYALENIENGNIVCSDVLTLNKLFENNYLVEDNSNINLETLDNEQCYSVISGRDRLEVSTSNLLAYFLQKDSRLTYTFLHDFLGITSVLENEKFSIAREENHIDLLFISENHCVVVENKVDSYINGKAENQNENGKYNSQLSDYYEYVNSTYSNIPNKSYFVLAPEYNPITQDELNNVFENGENYILKNYKELFDLIEHHEYRPFNLGASDQSKFLFKEFLKSIQYLTWSNAMKQKHTAFIRLKQRITELNNR